MNIVLFTWNPDKLPISDRDWARQVKQCADLGAVYGSWSTSRVKLIRPGDTALLLRQARDRGIVAKGTVTSEIYEEITWNPDMDDDAVDNYVEITWEDVLPIEERLRIEMLEEHVPEVSWVRYSSGTTVDLAFHDRVLELWDRALRESSVPRTQTARVHQSLVASDLLISEQRGMCKICGIDTQSVYAVNPLKLYVTLKLPDDSDECAVCPTCAAVVTRTPSARSVNQVRRTLSMQH